MKKIYGILLLSVFILFSGCSMTSAIRGSGAERVAAEVKKAGNLEGLCVVPGETAQNQYAMESSQIFFTLYGLNTEDCAEMCAYLAKNAMDVNEIAIFAFENEEQLNKVKLAVSKRLYTQMKQYQGLSETLYNRLADARYGVSGRYYYLIVAEKECADAAEKRILEFN